MASMLHSRSYLSSLSEQLSEIMGYYLAIAWAFLAQLSSATTSGNHLPSDMPISPYLVRPMRLSIVPSCCLEGQGT